MTNNRTQILVGFAAIFATASILYAMWIYFFVHFPISPPPPFPEVEYTTAGLLIPPNVHMYNGTVREVGNSYIVMYAASHNNYLKEDTALRIFFDKNTRFSKLTVPKIITEEVPPPHTQEIPMRKEEIELGRTVMVYSAQNLRDHREFRVDAVVMVD